MVLCCRPPPSHRRCVISLETVLPPTYVSANGREISHVTVLPPTSDTQTTRDFSRHAASTYPRAGRCCHLPAARRTGARSSASCTRGGVRTGRSTAAARSGRRSRRRAPAGRRPRRPSTLRRKTRPPRCDRLSRRRRPGDPAVLNSQPRF